MNIYTNTPLRLLRLLFANYQTIFSLPTSAAVKSKSSQVQDIRRQRVLNKHTANGTFAIRIRYDMPYTRTIFTHAITLALRYFAGNFDRKKWRRQERTNREGICDYDMCCKGELRGKRK